MNNWDYLKSLVVWYQTYWNWKAGNSDIRNFELIRTRRYIMLAGTVVRVDRRRAYHGI